MQAHPGSPMRALLVVCVVSALACGGMGSGRDGGPFSGSGGAGSGGAGSGGAKPGGAESGGTVPGGGGASGGGARAAPGNDAAGWANPFASARSTVDIVDPGMNGISAFSITPPSGWKVEQSFTREWPTAVPNNMVYVSLTSPDGGDRIEYLPVRGYGWSDGPADREYRAMARQMGLPETSATGMPPMSPVDYAKQYLVPQLAQSGYRLQVTGERSFPEERGASRGYVEGTLDNGKSARIEAQISRTDTQVGGETYVTWTVLPVVVQSSRNVAGCYDRMREVQASVVWNPEWQRQNNELVNRGMASNSSNSRTGHEARMDAIRHTGEVRDQAWRDRDASQDRQHAAFGDMIRGEARFDDPNTGQRVQIDDNYNHVFGDGQGAVIGTDTPTPPPGNWQELQRVGTEDY